MHLFLSGAFVWDFIKVNTVFLRSSSPLYPASEALLGRCWETLSDIVNILGPMYLPTASATMEQTEQYTMYQAQCMLYAHGALC